MLRDTIAVKYCYISCNCNCTIGSSSAASDGNKILLHKFQNPCYSESVF